MALDEEDEGIWINGLSGRLAGSLVASTADARGPLAWSPDSTRIALGRYGSCGRDGIHVLDVITCGPGRDRISADPDDRVARDCEHVQRR